LSVAVKMQKKFLHSLFGCPTVLKDKKAKKYHEIESSRFFLIILLVVGFYGMKKYVLPDIPFGEKKD
jgi:hypothetical protein